VGLDLAAGGSTTCAIMSSGTPQRIFCWGSNLHGECARNPVTTQPGCSASGGQAGGACGTPQEVLGFTDFDEVAVGDGHVCAHRSLTSEVLCWGDNAEGAVGVGAAGTIFTPTAVTFPGVTPRPRLALGNNHSCAITDGSDTGAVFCWGDNTAGQLGELAVGMASSQTPVQIMLSTGPLRDVASITAGAHHTCAQQTDGMIWCWGDNACGQLGDGNGGACDAPATPAPVPVPLPVNPLLICP
jgi:alpha-tubulin suppressor-like RCC1 family protein